MNTLMHADIFFFVTTIVSIVLAVIVAIALYYIVRILRVLHCIVEKIKHESDHVTEDIAALRMKIKEEGMKMTPVLALLGKFVFNRWSKSSDSKERKSHKRKAHKHDEDEESEDGE